MIRPQSKQQKELQEMRDNIKPGDEVVTIGGFYGIVYAIDEKNVVLEMLPDFNKAMVVKSAISRVITAEESLIAEDDDDMSTTEDVEVDNNDIKDNDTEVKEEKTTSGEGKA